MKQPSNPNKQLAAQIVMALKSQGLLPDQYEESVRQKLCSGKTKESDWRLWAETIVLAKERGNGEN